ncbi:MAG TPA: lamin tail domain-containing protein, partial [Methylomirabilota bacterium]|nr:lamin tail domain-containing protein [Methylomirabilota bacterium]
MNRLCLSVLLAVLSASCVRADTTLVFNEIMYHPATNEPAMEWVELYNQLAVDLDVSGWSLTGDIGYSFPAGTRVAGRSVIVVAINPAALTAATGLPNILGPFTNRLSNAGGTLRLRNNNGRVMDEVSYETEDEWPVAPDGAGPSLAKWDEDAGSVDAANWRASLPIGGTPGAINIPRTISATVTRTIVPVDQFWKYDQSGAELGSAWKEPGYDDSAWPSGRGVFGVEDNSAITTLTNTVLSLTNSAGERVITYYFRTRFTFTDNPANYFLRADNLLDDGAVVYLNGTEVYRYRLATNQNSQTLAENQANEGLFETFTFPSTALRQGTNVLAVEVHQVNTGSSDVVFGLRLDDGTTVTNTPGGSSATNLAVVFNELSSVTNGQFSIELMNVSTQSVTLDNFVLARFGNPTNREYVIPSGTIPAGGYFVLDRATLGFGADPGDRVVLYAPGKTSVLDALVAKSYPRARLPEGTGEWLRPSVLTPGASNQFALRNEIVINEIMYNHKAFPSVNGLPAEDSPEEWIELFNRSSNAVALTGWTLAGGISFQFPDGKVLAPGAYLIVAKDAASLRASYPTIDILGDFSGRLASDGETLRLEDANENPADVVRYYAGGRWAEYASGGGSSLELRNPNADNSKAESWAASDETDQSSWQSYSYRMVAQPSLTPNPDGTWRQFLMGLLGAGECLVDDIRVIQSPTNSPVSFIDNGDFENGATGWRVLGTHGSSRVIPEPGNPGNRVLHVIATATQEHMHNHIETTLANGQSVVNGQLYEISYRAKWLAGNSLLNTRLWFNRVARTMELPAPPNNGTPGAINSSYEANIGPAFAEFKHQPVVPAAGAPVTISAQVTDPQGVTNCQVFWSVAGGAFSNAPMTLQTNGTYRGTIPGFAAASIVQFYVRAVDGLGAVSTFPARGPNGGALYKVNDGQANVSLQHNIRIITTPAHATLLHADTNVMSNAELPCTVIYDERIAYYDVGLRLKGSMNGRPFTARVGFHLSFQPDELFRGVHPTLGLDRRPGDNSPRNEEIVVRHIAHRAGGIPVMYFDVMNVLSPRGTENGPALVQPSYEDNFIDTAFENGGDGTIYEMDGIYNSTTANAAGYRLPQPNNSQNYVDVADRGNDKEVYRYQFIRKNHHDQDNYTPLITMSKAFSLPNGPAFETQTRELLDMDEWLRAYAVLTLCGVSDTYSFGLQHNLMFYFRPSDNKAVYLMWDSDFSFNRSSTSAIVGDQNLARIVNLPANLRAFYAHLLDIIDTTYNTAYMSYWITHYAGFSGTSYSSRLSYIQQRSDFVKSSIASAGGNAPFSVSTTNITVTGSNLVTLSGTAPVQVKTITINGIAWPVTWTSLTAWTIRVPANAATNALQIAGLDVNGNLVTNTSFTATAVVNASTESPVGLVVFNEIMFHAAVPEAEYIELFNRSTQTTYDLSGWRVNGLDYTFPPGSYFAPRTYLVLAKNRLVFAATYGTGVPFDEFNGEVQRNGETLSLIRPGATPDQDLAVDQVRYEGSLPWPAAAADGTGSSYQLIDGAQDNSRAGNWAARHVPAVYQDGVSTPAITNAGWRFVSFSGSIGSGFTGGQQRLLIYLAEINGASAIIDDISLVAGTNAAVGANYIRNGDFESSPLLETPALTNSWVVNTNYTNSAIINSLTHSGTGALRLEAATFGNSFGRIISQNLSPAPPANSTNTLSFWFWSTNSATNLIVRIQNSPALTTGNAGTNILPSITPSNYTPA